MLAEKGKLSAADVSAVRQVTVQSSLETLPDALFDVLQDDPMARARRTLEALIAEGLSKHQLLKLVQALPELGVAGLGAQAA